MPTLKIQKFVNRLMTLLSTKQSCLFENDVVGNLHKLGHFVKHIYVQISAFFSFPEMHSNLLTFKI